MKQWIVPILIITLAACADSGGSGGRRDNGSSEGNKDNSSSEGNRGHGGSVDNHSENPKLIWPDSTVLGMVTDAQVANAAVDFYRFTPEGPGAPLAESVRTDAQGQFDQIINAPDGYVLIVANEGSYSEEETDVVVSLGHPHQLKALTYFESGKTIETVINPWSTVAFGYVECRLAEGESLDNAVSEARDLISGIIGISAQPTYPINPTDEANKGYDVVDDGIKLGALAAGISKWTSDEAIKQGLVPHGPGMTSIDFVLALYHDISSDCRLDGFAKDSEGNPSTLAFGRRLLDTNVYRTEIPRKVLEFMNLGRNKTLVSSAQLEDYAYQYASNTAVVYGDSELGVLDEQGPSIDYLAIKDGQYVHGQVEFSLEVTDFSGVEALSVAFGDSSEISLDVGHPVVEFSSEAFDDGPLKVVVRAIDGLNNVNTKEITLNIQNTQPIMKLKSGALVKTSTYDFEMVVDNLPQGIQSVLVDGKAFSFDGLSVWGKLLLKQGQNLIPIELIDLMGVRHKTIKTIFLDLIKPTIGMRVPSTYPEEQFQVRYLPVGAKEPVWRNFTDSSEDGILVPRDRRYCGSLLLEESKFKALGWPYIAITALDAGDSPDGVLRPGDLTVTYSYQIGDEVRIKDRMASLNDGVRYYVPFCQEFLGDDWWKAKSGSGEASIRFVVKDRAGIESSKTFSFTFVENATTFEPQLGDDVFLSPNANSIAFDATGMDGIESVEIYIDGKYHDNVADYTTGVAHIATEALKDGLHQAYFVLKEGNEVILQTNPVKFRIDNTPPVVHLISQPISNTERYLVEFSVDDGLGAGFDPTSVRVSNPPLSNKVFNEVAKTDRGTYTVAVDLVPGINPLVLDFKDTIGNKQQVVFDTIGYDAHAPILNWLYPNYAVSVYGYNEHDPVNPIVLQPLLVSDTPYPLYLNEAMANFYPSSKADFLSIQPLGDERVGWRAFFAFSYSDNYDKSEWGRVGSDHIDAYYEVYLNDGSEPIHTANLIKDQYSFGSAIFVNREDLGEDVFRAKETTDVKIKIYLKDKVGHESRYETRFQVYFDPEV